MNPINKEQFENLFEIWYFEKLTSILVEVKTPKHLITKEERDACKKCRDHNKIKSNIVLVINNNYYKNKQ